MLNCDKLYRSNGIKIRTTNNGNVQVYKSIKIHQTSTEIVLSQTDSKL